MSKYLYFLPILLFAVGGWFLFRLRAFFLIRPIRCFRALMRGLGGGRGAFSSLMLALAGTLGVGNIVGVSLALSLGGRGAAFWLLVSSVFAAAVKYCEAVLSSGESEGMLGVLKRSWKWGGIAAIYALFLTFLAFGMGSALQARSITSSASILLSVKPLLPSLAVTFLVILGIRGGGKIIDKLTAVLVPFATVLYAGMCLAVIFANAAAIPETVASILDDAFSFRSAGGGVIAFFSSRALREGMLAGILSNEAGAGTSSFAHSRSDLPPAVEGLSGIAEILCDTPILCMLTALSILLCGTAASPDGISPVIAALSTVFGKCAPVSLFVCLSVFAYATILCWFYYGSVGFKYLTRGRGYGLYRVAFLLSVFLGGLVETGFLVTLSDFLLFLLSLITFPTLIKNSDRILSLSEKEDFFMRSSICRSLLCRCRERPSSMLPKDNQAGSPERR